MDPQLRVHGVQNLRVIDTSVIPVIPDCRIQMAVYMIGEKGELHSISSYIAVYVPGRNR